MEKVISQQSPKKNVCFSAHSSLEKETFLPHVYFISKINGLFCFFSFQFNPCKNKILP